MKLNVKPRAKLVAPHRGFRNSGQPIPRNSLCPCGSGKKAKHCHLAKTAGQMRFIPKKDVLDERLKRAIASNANQA